MEEGVQPIWARCSLNTRLGVRIAALKTTIVKRDCSGTALPCLQFGFTNFVELHRAWQKALDSSELNKKFFKELSNWYFWALKNVTFPEDAGTDEEVRNATSIIRLITRLIFIWFIKEKNLVPEELFNQRKLQNILKNIDPKESTYYKAILQNGEVARNGMVS
jgi:adenine-specific DNA-methyltransferase